VNRVEIQKGEDRQLVYCWFQEQGRDLTNEYLVKFFIFWDALTHHRTDGALVRLTTVLRPGEECGPADARLKDFAAKLGGSWGGLCRNWGRGGFVSTDAVRASPHPTRVVGYTLDISSASLQRGKLVMAADYDRDLYTWSQEQAALLRERKFDQIDLVHIVEEIEDMGKSEQRALESYLEALLIHLLKWVYQPSFRGRSWRLTIIEKRKRLLKHLRENPGLKSRLDVSIADAYEFARSGAEKETGLPASTFPHQCPWTYEVLSDPDFWPDGVA
jgi:hypothetical protein